MKPVAKLLSGLIKNRARVAAILLCLALGLSLTPMMSACDASPREGGTVRPNSDPPSRRALPSQLPRGRQPPRPRRAQLPLPLRRKNPRRGRQAARKHPAVHPRRRERAGEPPRPRQRERGLEAHFIDLGRGRRHTHTLRRRGPCSSTAATRPTAASSIPICKKRDIGYLDYIVCTHPDEDHVGGLSGALNYASVGTALCPVTAHDTKAFSNFVKYLDKQNVSITVPTAGDTFMLGGAFVQILGPQRSYSDTNNMSIVMKVVYGQTSFLFTGGCGERRGA